MRCNMRLDQDKQIEDLAKFQREMLGSKELTEIGKKHLRNQGALQDSLNSSNQKTEE